MKKNIFLFLILVLFSSCEFFCNVIEGEKNIEVDTNQTYLNGTYIESDYANLDSYYDKIYFYSSVSGAWYHYSYYGTEIYYFTYEHTSSNNEYKLYFENSYSNSWVYFYGYSEYDMKFYYNGNYYYFKKY